MIKYEAGQVLWYVPRDGRNARELKVTSVGRKWARLGPVYRVGLDSTHVDGGDYCSPGRLYLSKEAHEQDTLRCHLWSQVRQATDCVYTPPAHLSTDTIQQVAALLNPSLEAE